MLAARCHFLLGVLLLVAAQGVNAQSVRILNVGDSDVSGYQGYASYRYDLWFLLVNAGYDVDFVGQRFAPIAFVQEELYPNYEQFDNHHEGRFGRTLGEMSANAVENAEENDPHIVLLMNSVDLCSLGSGAIGLVSLHFSNIIDDMRSVNPDLHFLLAQNYPYSSHVCVPNLTDLIPDYNQAIAQVASSKNTASSRVVAVNHFAGFNIATMLHSSNGHANRQGEMFLAANWFDALETVIPLVEVEVEASIPINAGLNDSWYNPATPGQGFFITVFPDIQMMFLAWFTFDTERPPAEAVANLGEPGHRWLTAFGPYSGNTADLEIEVTSGGIFNAASPAPGQQADGSILLEFATCNEATVSFDIVSTDIAGEIPIERIAPDNLPACEALAQ